MRQRTGAAFGATLSLHLFRDVAATGIALSDPEHARNIALILGHANFKTTKRHYLLAKSRNAFRLYREEVLTH